MNISDNISKRNKELSDEITKLKKIMSTLPEGKLRCCTDRGVFRFYNVCDHKRIYLGKNDTEFTRDLVLKDYCRLRIAECENELSAGNAYRKISDKKREVLQNRLNHPEYIEMLKKSGKLDVIPLNYEQQIAWMNEPYDHNEFRKGDKIYRMKDGKCMRSKSEIIIATMLSGHQLAYRYECLLELENRKFYPDFTIMHPRSGKIYFWEHNGMLDDPEYRRKMFWKDEIYFRNNIIPGANLILTWETKDHPLDMSFVESMIEIYFL